MRSILISFLFTLFWGTAMSQFNVHTKANDDYYEGEYLRFDNHSYRDNIKTVMLHLQGWPLALPIITIGEDQPMELHFDVLDSTLGNYMYTIIHCDYDWTQSDLDKQEYLDGPFEDYLTEYDYSRNTYQRFIHYTLEIPNFTTRITKSGNYLIKVFEEGDENLVILTRRFCVVESQSPVSVNVNVHQATRVNQRYSHQEVDFNVSFGSYALTNPYTDLKVVVLQNHTWETALTGLQPRFVKDRELDYDYDGENAFEGLNEFRLLDIADTRYTGRGVKRVTFNDNENHAYLEQDKSRSAITYLQNPDLNGWFYIKNNRVGTEGTVDADYVHTHFSLKHDAAIQNGDIYIYGALTDWQIKPEAKMQFDQLELQYEASLYLKQGLYNYLYVFVKDGEMQPDMTFVEGSHFETENDYTVLIYHRTIGLDYDKLISVQEFKYSNN